MIQEGHMQNLKREVLAGLTTFLAMIYIAFLMPSFLKGSPLTSGETTSNSILGCAIATLFFCTFSKKPYAFGPGIVPAGVCASFYAAGSNWESILSAVLVSGLVFTSLALSGSLKIIAGHTPEKLKSIIKFFKIDQFERATVLGGFG
jgi:AGZA family xanthine/uracil permease-like MFS transporter